MIYIFTFNFYIQTSCVLDRIFCGVCRWMTCCSKTDVTFLLLATNDWCLFLKLNWSLWSHPDRLVFCPGTPYFIPVSCQCLFPRCFSHLCFCQSFGHRLVFSLHQCTSGRHLHCWLFDLLLLVITWGKTRWWLCSLCPVRFGVNLFDRSASTGSGSDD